MQVLSYMCHTFAVLIRIKLITQRSPIEIARIPKKLHRPLLKAFLSDAVTNSHVAPPLPFLFRIDRFH